jgi:predicted flap endonuclease-1-like 5' DNA nuclease
MQRPTNSQFGILCVSAAGAFVIFLIYFMLFGGYGFLSSVFSSLLMSLIIAATIFLFVMTSSGKDLADAALTRVTAAATEARSKLKGTSSSDKFSVGDSMETLASLARAWSPAKLLSRGAPDSDAPITATSSSAYTSASARVNIPERAPEKIGIASKPAGIDAPQGVGADDLKKIKGIGPKTEELLNRMGYFHFHQIAEWTNADVAWIDQNLINNKGRAGRDEWVGQAKVLCSE